MKIDVLCVGKLKERYFTEAVEEYRKRLGRYCQLEIREVPDEPAPENASPAQAEQVKEAEGKRLLRWRKPEAYAIALAIDGKALSSEGLAQKLENLGVSGRSHIQFLIGGSLGLSPEVLRQVDYHLSFSAMTFPHQLMRVILLEQIYRSFRIIRGEPYHK